MSASVDGSANWTFPANVSVTGRVQASTQPCFFAQLSADDLNQTGNGTNYFLGTNVGMTERFDIGANFSPGPVAGGCFFTAPVTGKYYLHANLRMGGLTAGMSTANMSIVTTAATYSGARNGINGMRDNSNICDMEMSVIADMTAGNTAKVSVQISNATLVANLLGGIFTYFEGYLIG